MRETPVTFSPDEAQEIRRTLAVPDTAFVCPRCGADLVIQGPIGGGGAERPVWEVYCPPCHRSLYVMALPEGRRPQGG